jgi:hypothetical protein
LGRPVTTALIRPVPDSNRPLKIQVTIHDGKIKSITSSGSLRPHSTGSVQPRIVNAFKLVLEVEDNAVLYASIQETLDEVETESVRLVRGDALVPRKRRCTASAPLNEPTESAPLDEPTESAFASVLPCSGGEECLCGCNGIV